MRVSFVVPAYNEAPTIADVLERVSALALDKQIIIVDDGSTDGTAEAVRDWAQGRDGVKFVSLPENRGKGAAIREAIPHLDGDIVVIQDADLEYDPVDVPALIEPIQRGVADVVFGSRLSGGRPQRAYLFWHLVGNRFLSLVTNVLFTRRCTTWRPVTRRYGRASSARSTCARTGSASSPRSRQRCVVARCASSSYPSPTTGEPTPRERRSPGVTARALWVLARVRIHG